MFRRLVILAFVFATLFACSLIAGRGVRSTYHAPGSVLVITKSPWNAFRAGLKLLGDPSESRRTTLDEDDDDELQEEMATGTTAPNVSDHGDEAADAAPNYASERSGPESTPGPNGCALRASRGFGVGTERPPQRA